MYYMKNRLKRMIAGISAVALLTSGLSVLNPVTQSGKVAQAADTDWLAVEEGAYTSADGTNYEFVKIYNKCYDSAMMYADGVDDYYVSQSYNWIVPDGVKKIDLFLVGNGNPSLTAGYFKDSANATVSGTKKITPISINKASLLNMGEFMGGGNGGNVYTKYNVSVTPGSSHSVYLPPTTWFEVENGTGNYSGELLYADVKFDSYSSGLSNVYGKGGSGAQWSGSIIYDTATSAVTYSGHTIVTPAEAGEDGFYAFDDPLLDGVLYSAGGGGAGIYSNIGENLYEYILQNTGQDSIPASKGGSSGGGSGVEYASDGASEAWNNVYYGKPDGRRDAMGKPGTGGGGGSSSNVTWEAGSALVGAEKVDGGTGCVIIRWEKACSVSYDVSTNGGTSIVPETVTDVSPGTTFNATSAVLSPTASKIGYTFVGWNTNKDAKAGLTSLTVNNDTTLYAIFKKDVTATFKDANDSGTQIRTKTAYMWNTATTAMIELLSQNSKTGWTALGWSTSSTTDVSKLVSGTAVTLSANQTYYGLYKKKVSVGIDTDGDEKPDIEEEIDIYINGANPEITEGTITLPSTVPVKTGYTFTGWSEEGGDGLLHACGETITITGTGIIKANFVPNNYSVEYYLDGGKMGSSDMVYDTAGRLKTAAALAIQKKGYDFTGWSKTEGSTAEYTDGQEVKNLTTEANGVVKLYAVLTAHTYKITYEGVENATNSNQTTYTVENSTFTLKDPVWKGHLFLGWTTDAITTPTKGLVVDTTQAADMTYTAVWKEEISVTVPVTTEFTITAGKTCDKSEIAIRNNSVLPVSVSASFVQTKTGDMTLVDETSNNNTDWSSLGRGTKKMALYVSAGKDGNFMSDTKNIYASSGTSSSVLGDIAEGNTGIATIICNHVSGISAEDKEMNIGNYTLNWTITLK